jgi:hypothetical protein
MAGQMPEGPANQGEAVIAIIAMVFGQSEVFVLWLCLSDFALFGMVGNSSFSVFVSLGKSLNKAVIVVLTF